MAPKLDGFGFINAEAAKERPLHREGRSGNDGRRWQQLSRGKADGALPLRHLEGEAVLRRHPFEDWIQGGRAGRSRLRRELDSLGRISLPGEIENDFSQGLVRFEVLVGGAHFRGGINLVDHRPDAPAFH